MIPLSVMAEGISGMENGIADYRAAGAMLAMPFFLRGMPSSKSRASASLPAERPWLNILIASKEVVGVILRFDFNKTFKVVAVRRFYPTSTFVLHEKIHIGTSEAIGFNGSPIVSRPFRD